MIAIRRFGALFVFAVALGPLAGCERDVEPEHMHKMKAWMTAVCKCTTKDCAAKLKEPKAVEQADESGKPQYKLESYQLRRRVLQSQAQVVATPAKQKPAPRQVAARALFIKPLDDRPKRWSIRGERCPPLGSRAEPYSSTASTTTDAPGADRREVAAF
jgi:hypothetical protein